MEIEERVVFVTKPEQVKFTTQTNGDTVVIENVLLDKLQAASLALLVNTPDVDLEFLIRIK